MIDNVDKKILEILQNNCRTSNAEIARQVNLTPTAIVDRINKMERKGVLRGFTALVSPEALGCDLLSFVFITVNPQKQARQVGEALTTIPCVTEVHHLTGEECFMCKVRSAGTKGLEQVLQDMHAIEAVHATRSVIAFKAVSEQPGVLAKDFETE